MSLTRFAELHVSRIPRTSLSKALLRSEITFDTFAEYVTLALRLLLEDLYPLRSAQEKPDTIYSRHHAQRIALARRYFRRLPYLASLLNAGGIPINGVTCPSINQFLAWLDAYASRLFVGSTLVAVHGNFPDNILYDPIDTPSKHSTSFIDPRGDLVGPPHYDIAKLLITLEAYYEEIHYGAFDVVSKEISRNYDIRLEIDDTHSEPYSAALAPTRALLAKFAAAEALSKSQFMWAVYTCECIHILSFCFYHAYRADTPPERIRAFFGVSVLRSAQLSLLFAAEFDSVFAGFASDGTETSFLGMASVYPKNFWNAPLGLPSLERMRCQKSVLRMAY